MSGECERYHELGIKKNYFAQMFFDGGYTSNVIAICDQIILSCDDVVLNMAAQRLGGQSNGIMILFGLGVIKVFKYENKKLTTLY